MLYLYLCILQRKKLELTFSNFSTISDTHVEELDSVQKFIEIKGWLPMTFSICLHNQLSFFNSIIVQMSEKHDSSNKQYK